MMYHCCLDVEAVRDKTLPLEWRAMCITAKALGYKVIPIGTACDNFDYLRADRQRLQAEEDVRMIPADELARPIGEGEG